MTQFDREIFGKNIRKFRIAKGYSQKKLADSLNVTDATFSRYESGEILPNAEQVWKICNELEVDETDLYEVASETKEKEITKENQCANPFDSNTLYLYTIDYNPTTCKFEKVIFKLVLRQMSEKIQVKLYDLQASQSYLEGYMLTDNNMAFIILDSNENNSKLQVANITINLKSTNSNDMLGTYTGINDNNVPCTKKCIISKKKKEFTKKMSSKLRITIEEKIDMLESDIWYVDLVAKCN